MNNFYIKVIVHYEHPSCTENHKLELLESVSLIEFDVNFNHLDHTNAV